MKKLNELLQELGVSKVKLAKYLGVSRQMVYNYLVLDDLEKWPKEKKILLLKLLDIPEGDDKALENIDVTTEYMMEVEKRLNTNVKNSNVDYLSGNTLSKEKKHLLNDIIFLLKEKLEDDTDNDATTTMHYLYYLLQAMENIPEIKYLLAYMAKSNCFIKPDEYYFDEDKQFTFEGILYTAISLYNSGKSDKKKVAENHRLFIQEIEQKNEEKLSRTQQLMTFKDQALRELGYDDINKDNAVEFYEKLAEIEARKL